MKIGIIKERKSPPDRRVVFSPQKLAELQKQFPHAEIKVEPSDIRVFKDEEYKALGFELSNDLSDCDILLGVKEVPVEALIPGKKYFFFSHTIKKQAHNRKLLQAIINKHIDLYDHETIVDANNKRLIGFGQYAGNVGAYNCFRAFGLKFDLFNLPKAETLPDKQMLISKLKKQFLPPVKIVLTGKGKVGMGAKEILDAIKVKEVSVENFLTKTYTEPVYVQLDVTDYNRRKDGKEATKEDFYINPDKYESDFERFSTVADIFIAGHFYANGSPAIVTRDMLASKNNKIKVIADISCDVAGPIASTLRASTIAEPFYGYHPGQNTEIDMYHPSAIVVMAVDNLPCELPKDASEGFGDMFLKHVIPAFFNDDADGILKRALITHNGNLTERFKYLEDYISENNEVPHN
ncbi:NAD(P)-dependent oxidoreductase [Flavobacterium beibuense]|uniref:Saccharopine dehydrogenase [NAD(+), L-lysine-forming] n=1 Tax=Flavobacterium beibuense TaxID=657326 RepID=A0A444WEN8_9FLAO|nr:NAD(P)-dependent oxidoreductase [Flavobacterium beibuense]RYJ44320.1 putative monofunctional lysine-ketoglutarate reductase [Flavobacterium beibuense]